MDYLSSVDIAVIVGYLAMLVGLGFYLRRFASKSLEDYLVGGRKLPWWVLGVSGMASYLDVAGTMLIVSFLYLLGPRGMYIEFRGGAVLTLAFILLWGGKWHRRSKCLTQAEWMIFRFGDGPAGRFAQLISMLSGVMGTIGLLAYLSTGIGIFLSMFLPFTPMTCAILLVCVATLYTMISGFYGVIFTDLFQTVIILTAVAVISTMAYVRVGACEDLPVLAAAITGNAAWTSVVPHWKTVMPKGYEAYQHLLMFAVFYLMRTAFFGASMGYDPKYFGARNDRECGILTWLWITLITVRWPMMIGFAVLGLFLAQDLFPDQSVLLETATLVKTHVPDVTAAQWKDVTAGIIHSPEQFSPDLIAGIKGLLGESNWVEKLHLVSFDGNINPERIMPAVLLLVVWHGLRGLLVAALIAASMSTFDSLVNVACGLVVRDVYQKYFRPVAKTRELIYISWATCAALSTCALLFAYSITSVNEIWGWFVMSFGSGLVVPFFLRLFWWRFNGMGFAVGTAAGMLFAVIQRLLLPELDERLQFLLLGAVGGAGAIIGTYLAAPTEQKVLEDFYRITRPFGLWGRLKHTLAPDVRSAMEREHRNDIIAIPFVLIWQITLFLIPMQVVLHTWESLPVTLALFFVGLAGMWYVWYRNLPDENFPGPQRKPVGDDQ